jgi:CubicO group peptidase (beta-lactamase class C family)
MMKTRLFPAKLIQRLSIGPNMKFFLNALCFGFVATLIASTNLLAQTSQPDTITPDPLLADIDSVVEAELKKWNTPGIAITVVKDGKVILQKGYGLRDQEKNLPMTARTVQPIASVTKSFTVAALGTLVREGKLNWDKPVRDYLPDFKMHNQYATMNVTPRDLVTHRTGVPRHDSSWFNASASREELYKRIPHLEPSAPLRSIWQYNNFMYMTAGYMAGKVALNRDPNTDWETLVRNSIFTPLGMASSNFTIDDLKKTPDFATGYQWNDKETPVPIPYTGLTAMGPTGSINTNMEDMSRYLRMYLQRGELNGRRILNAADIVEMTNPQMVLPDARTFEEISAMLYGMGFFVTHYRGERAVQHGGNMPGASSLLSFFPQRNIGIFTTTNLSESLLPNIISLAIYDRLLNMKPINWSERFWQRKEKEKASVDGAKKQNLTPQKHNTQPAHELSEYVGEFEHPGYGVVAIARDRGNALRITYNDLTTALKHFHFEVFEAPENKLNDLSKTKVAFQTNIEGDVNALAIALEPNVKPIVFSRLPEKTFGHRAFLEKFVGEYELGATRINVVLRPDNVLVFSIPGQVTRELSGIRGNKFAVKGLNDYTVEFIANKAGEINQAAVYQTNGNFVAKKR